MKAINRSLFVLLSVIFILLMFSGCVGQSASSSGETVFFSSYRDIPGVTPEEISAIEALREKYDSFVYGMVPNTEAFYDTNGEVSGYAAHISKWLTDLFGIEFNPIIVNSWGDFLGGLESGEINFTGDLTPTPERRQTYFMTDAISHRSLIYIRIAGSQPLSEIRKTRLPRYLLVETTTNAEDVLLYAINEFEPVFITDFEEIYGLLKSGKVDAFITENTAEAFFDEYGDIVSEDFLPLIHSPVSFATQMPELAPIVSVVQKALENGVSVYLNELNEIGYHEYVRHKLFLQLTEEEREYIKTNPVVSFGAETYNYPVSFYNARNKEWQGICFDVLKEIEKLSGLKFTVANEVHASWVQVLGMLENGDIPMISELIRTQEREGRFLWPDALYRTDYSALISKVEHRNINIREVLSVRVGMNRGTAYTEFFNRWFPNHDNVIYFDSLDGAFNALMNDEVDMVMSGYSTLLYLTNYQERADFKANIIFDSSFSSTFGFNRNEAVLCSIIDKTLNLIDTETISQQWIHRTYDYRLRIAQAQMPWVIGISVLLLVLLVYVSAVYIMNTKKSRLIAEQTAAYDAAEMANKAKSAFLANMSHEIRTPMNAILCLTEILIHHDNLPKEVAEGLGKIYNSCDLLLGIINDILDFSKIEAGKLDIVPAQYKVANLISESIQLNIMRVDAKPIEFEVNVHEGIPSKLIGDKLRIKQILNNLLSNAFKYTETGKVTLTVDCGPYTEGVILIIKVQDTGYGMSNEQIDKLFFEYSRFHQKKNRTIEGTGLGMAITRQLLKLMDGEIHVESELGKGSLFTVWLPQVKVDNEILGKEEAENLRRLNYDYMPKKYMTKIVRDPMPYGKVLIVDDVETNLDVAEGLMKLYDLNIDTVMNGESAIEKIKSGKEYDAIFMDHMMPEMDGIETTKRIRDLGYTKPIIALTANAVVGQSEMFLQNGFDDFIAKPINIRQLNAVLNKFIRDIQPKEVVKAAREKKGMISEEDKPQMSPKILSSFIRDAKKAVAVFEELSHSGALKTEEGLHKFTITVHGMKSSLGNIGEEQLSENAYKLEQSGRDRNSKLIAASIQEFISDLRALLEKLDKEAEVKIDNEDKAKLHKILMTIRDMCANYNRKGILDILEEVKICTKETKDVLDNIKEFVMHSEFEEAETAAAALAATLFLGEENENKEN